MRTKYVSSLLATSLVVLATRAPAEDLPDRLPPATLPVTEAPSLLDLIDVEQILRRATEPPSLSFNESIARLWFTARTTAPPSLLDAVDLEKVLDRTAGPRHRTAGELIALAPSIESSDPACRSIEIKGYFEHNDHVRLTFRALYRAPDRYSLLLRDDPEGPPLMYAAGRQLLVYDPVRPVVLYSEKARFRFAIFANETEFKIDWKFWPDSKASSSILFDVRSLLMMPARKFPSLKDVVTKENDGGYVLSRSWNERDVMCFRIDPAHNCPYTSLGFFSRDNSKGPFLFVDRIAVNEPLNDDEFAFPTREKLAETMNVRLCSDDGLLRQLGDVGLMLRGTYARLAVHYPELRESIRFPGLPGIDWGQVKENDQNYSKLLREALSTARQ